MMGGEERGRITAVLLPPGRATISWTYSEEILMPSLWKVSRWQFSDGHPTEFFGEPVKSLHLILLYCRKLSSGSAPSKFCSCCSSPTCRQHFWMKYQQDHKGFCESHLTLAEKLMHSFPYHMVGHEQHSHHSFSVPATSLHISQKCRVCMLSRHPGGEWNVYPADLGQSYTLYKSFSFLCTLLFWDRNEAHSSVFLINWVVSLAICPSESTLHNFLYKPDDSLLHSPPGLTKKAGVEVRKFL